MRRILWLCCLIWATVVSAADRQVGEVRVPVLCYHRFGPSVSDGMTIRTATFERQLRYLADNGYSVIPLRQLLDHLAGRGPALPPRPVVITIDDGHRSVYEAARPLLRRYKVPVTLFIYPSAISNASYAMSWEQLHELVAGGAIDIQSHTYWHPNFKIEKRRLSPEAYRTLVEQQLGRARSRLQTRFGTTIDVLAWPFGIYDAELEQQAAAAGYRAAFSIDGRPVSRSERPMALPRYLMVEAIDDRAFARLVAGER
ncbi:polysaccharide deacetylase family protein [Chitinimonas lacunae]|uniref:Polysaccharide deacetylase family protein n=1 Tax=Chitinimonas lacunae TaxID=1963018 RepID=A0ABV8MNC3_9NEIS